MFDGYMVAMDEANVPQVGRILYTTPVIRSMLKNAKELTRFIQNGDAAIQRAVSSLEEVRIEDVPSALMKTKYDFTEGWKPGENAQQINMLLVHPSAVITPEKYTFAQLDSPSAGSEGKWIYFEEAYGDVFILNKRKDAIKFHISSAAAASVSAIFPCVPGSSSSRCLSSVSKTSSSTFTRFIRSTLKSRMAPRIRQ